MPDGVLQGPSMIWDANGHLIAALTIDSAGAGKETTWNTRGVKIRERCHARDEVAVTDLGWDDDGHLSEAFTRKAGKREGPAARWKDGQQVEATTFVNDEPVEAYLRRPGRVLHYVKGKSPSETVPPEAFPEWKGPLASLDCTAK